MGIYFMRFALVTTTSLPLQPQLQWLWYSNDTSSFIANGFAKLGSSNPGGTVKQMAVSTCERYVAVTDQESSVLRIFSMKAS
jgi:hypothetical protein